MTPVNLAFVLAHAARATDHTGPDGAFAEAVAGAVEVGTVVPSILRRNLADAGLEVVGDKVAVSDYGFASGKVLRRVLVVDKSGSIVAMGAASDEGEALLAAVLGWCREHPLEGLDPTQPLAQAPTNPLNN